jgi:serine/threonine protein kinase
MIGTTVSHYRILEQLGAGGMGVVYKAEDTQLKRTVALKFLPLSLTTDAEARERFIHEAQAASALDHPNICAIYDFGTTDDGQMFIVMACYKGETLKSKIESGPLQLNDALDILVQIALGLSKAHQHGIVHRDIKPANIMVTEQAEVKILDFGLAKLSGRSMMTRTGSTLGTVAYMSPEQARGEKVDQRTDLWSLGVVSYQMLTGELPFESDYEQALIYSIINEEARGIRRLKKELPESIELIIRRLLSKEPAERYASADDLLADLLAVREGLPVKLRLPRPGRKQVRKRFARWVYAVGATVLIIAIVAAILNYVPRRPAKTNANFTSKLLRTQQFKVQGEVFFTPGISSDGNWISYAAQNDSGRWDILFSHISWSQSRKVSDLEQSPLSVNISPEGDVIAVKSRSPARSSSRTDSLLFFSTAGGEKRVVDETVFMGGGWSSIGARYSYVRRPSAERRWEVCSVNKAGTDKRVEFSDSLIIWAVGWSPDTRSMVISRGLADAKVLVVRDLETGRERQITFDKDADEPVWMSNGTILYSSSRSGGEQGLWAVAEDGGESQPVGNITAGNVYVRASHDGKRLIVSQYDVMEECEISDLNGKNPHGFASPPAADVRFTSDFSAIAYATWGYPATESSLYVADGTGLNPRRILHTPGYLNFGYSYLQQGWSPDNRWIAYVIGDTLTVVEVANPTNSKRICENARRWMWMDSVNIIVQTNEDKMRSIQYSLDQSGPVTVSEDSTFGRPILGGRYFLYIDFKKNPRRSWKYFWPPWHIAALDSRGSIVGEPKLLPDSIHIFSPDGRVGLFFAPGKWDIDRKLFTHELWKVSLPDLRMERVQKTYAGYNTMATTRGARKIASGITTATIRVTLIENLFEE